MPRLRSVARRPYSAGAAYGKTDLRAAHRTFAANGIRALSCAVQRQPQGPEFHMHRPVPVHGVCATAHTLANANATRDWRIYADFAQRLISIARKLYINEPFGIDLVNTAYTLDSTTIDLSLSLFPWAPFSNHEGRGEGAHTARCARQYPEFYPYQRRQAARRQHPRSTDSGSWSVLHAGRHPIAHSRAEPAAKSESPHAGGPQYGRARQATP